MLFPLSSPKASYLQHFAMKWAEMPFAWARSKTNSPTSWASTFKRLSYIWFYTTISISKWPKDEKFC